MEKTQDEKWKLLSQDDRDYYQSLYNAQTTRQVIKNCLEFNFGEHNLQPKPKIRTWKDVKELNPNYEQDCQNIRIYTNMINNNLKVKLLATYKIATLIKLGYGGLVTDEEWKDKTKIKYVISPRISYDNSIQLEVMPCKYEKRSIAFHTQEQANEFLLHYENRELVKQFCLI